MSKEKTLKELHTQVAQYCFQHLGSEQIELLSDSNNLVFRLFRESPLNDLVVRIIIDEGIDVQMVLLFEEHGRDLGILLPKTITFDGSKTHIPYPVVVQEFLKGKVLADCLQSSSRKSYLSRRFADTAVQILQCCGSIHYQKNGFGYIKQDRKLYATMNDFYIHTVDRYIQKIGAVVSSEHKWIVDIGSRLASRLLEVCALYSSYSIVPIDVNLRNFILNEVNEIAVLNIPLFARTNIVHGISSFAFQMQGLCERNEMIGYLLEKMGLQISNVDIASFEALATLGVLSFYAQHNSSQLANATAWGSDVRLVDILRDTLLAAKLL